MRGEKVRTDDDGSVFWCSQGNELIGKDVCRESDSVLGKVTKFVTDPRKGGGAVARFFWVQYSDETSEVLNISETKAGVTRHSSQRTGRSRKRPRGS